jgi:hypothetical protein
MYEYPAHYLLKKNRLIILKQHGYKCFICNKKAMQVHHRDYSKTNHCLSNLMPICSKCHIKVFHLREKKTSKFKKLYGDTEQKLAIKLGISSYQVRKLHYFHKLPDFIQKHDLTMFSSGSIN